MAVAVAVALWDGIYSIVYFESLGRFFLLVVSVCVRKVYVWLVQVETVEGLVKLLARVTV